MGSGDVVEIVGAGWTGGLNAVRQNIPIFSATFVVMLIIAAIFQPLLPKWHHLHHASSYHPVPTPIDIHVWLLETAQNILDSIAAAPSMVAVHRFVLLKEHGKTMNNIRRLVFFALWISVFHFATSLPGLFMDRTDFVAFILIVLVYYCMPRLVMSFPAVALDIQDPIRDSWKRARGHWWKIVGVMVLGFLPMLLLVLFVIGANDIIRIAIVSVLATVSPVLGAGLASELYRSYGGLTRQAT